MLESDERHWWYRGRRRVLRAALDRLPLGTGAWLLDAGCGSGRTLDELARYGTACGVDVSEAAVQAARLRGHDVRLGAVEALPFADGTFDLVTCLDVIEHTPDDGATLRELLRVTRPGGLLIAALAVSLLLGLRVRSSTEPLTDRARRSPRNCGDVSPVQVFLQQQSVQPSSVFEADGRQPSRVDEAPITVQRKGSGTAFIDNDGDDLSDARAPAIGE